MLSSVSYFHQKIKFNNVKVNRIDFFKEKIKDYSTLHIGCADWPIYNPASNLHINLFSSNQNVEGYDVDKETIANMKTTPALKDAVLYDSLPSKRYDFLLIPETLEHVNNIEHFLSSIIPLVTNETQILITAPNAFCNEHVNRNYKMAEDEYVEVVHPDHNCWYSLYTLPNVIRKVYKKVDLDANFTEIGLLENETMVYALFTLNV